MEEKKLQDQQQKPLVEEEIIDSSWANVKINDIHSQQELDKKIIAQYFEGAKDRQERETIKKRENYLKNGTFNSTTGGEYKLIADYSIKGNQVKDRVEDQFLVGKLFRMFTYIVPIMYIARFFHKITRPFWSIGSKKKEARSDNDFDTIFNDGYDSAIGKLREYNSSDVQDEELREALNKMRDSDSDDDDAQIEAVASILNSCNKMMSRNHEKKKAGAVLDLVAMAISNMSPEQTNMLRDKLNGISTDTGTDSEEINEMNQRFIERNS